jgi:thioredoxin-like negative regulator of GroEL
MKRIFCLSALFLFLLACSDERKKQIEALKKETMDIHDEAMKDLADMNRVSRKLKEFMISAVMTPEQSAQYTAVLAAIGKADEDMTNWMRDYKDPKGMPAAEAIKYLEDQKQKIAKNRDDIRAALEAGKKLMAAPLETPAEKPANK